MNGFLVIFSTSQSDDLFSQFSLNILNQYDLFISVHLLGCYLFKASASQISGRHLPLLTKLLLEGTRAVVTVNPDLTGADVAIFLHFPPNIFRFLASRCWENIGLVFQNGKFVNGKSRGNELFNPFAIY